MHASCKILARKSVDAARRCFPLFWRMFEHFSQLFACRLRDACSNTQNLLATNRPHVIKYLCGASSSAWSSDGVVSIMWIKKPLCGKHKKPSCGTQQTTMWNTTDHHMERKIWIRKEFWWILIKTVAKWLNIPQFWTFQHHKFECLPGAWHTSAFLSRHSKRLSLSMISNAQTSKLNQFPSQSLATRKWWWWNSLRTHYFQR